MEQHTCLKEKKSSSNHTVKRYFVLFFLIKISLESISKFVHDIGSIEKKVWSFIALENISHQEGTRK